MFTRGTRFWHTAILGSPWGNPGNQQIKDSKSPGCCSASSFLPMDPCAIPSRRRALRSCRELLLPVVFLCFHHVTNHELRIISLSKIMNWRVLQPKFIFQQFLSWKKCVGGRVSGIPCIASARLSPFFWAIVRASFATRRAAFGFLRWRTTTWV